MSRSEYRSLLLSFIDRAGSGLVKTSIILFVLLMLAQLLLEIDAFRGLLSETYILEGSMLTQTGNS